MESKCSQIQTIKCHEGAEEEEVTMIIKAYAVIKPAEFEFFIFYFNFI